MINIVQAFFGHAGLQRNTGLRRGPIWMLPLAATVSLLFASDLHAADAGRSRFCDPAIDCPGRRPPGPPDRDARPFDGTLGRPCAYRQRFTPSGTRRVRVCF